MTFLLIPPYLIFAFFVMRNVLKKQNTRKRKWQMGLLTAFLLYLPFGWDVILGRAVFYGLCATQGGVHVYQTVELGPEYFDKDGVPLFYDRDYGFDEMSLAEIYYGSNEYNINYMRRLNIAKDEYMIVNENNNDVLGLYRTYIYFGGWFVNYTGFHVSGESCPPLEVLSKDLRGLSNKVFEMENR